MKGTGMGSPWSRVRGGAWLVAVLLLSACGNEEGTPGGPSAAPAPEPVSLANLDPALTDPSRSLMRSYLTQVDMDFSIVDGNLAELQRRIDAFLDNPDPIRLENVRSAWLDSHSAYELTTLHRYFAALILSDADALRLYELQYQINHWPILAGYVDYVQGYADSGIVNDINVTLDLPTLRQQHGVFDLSEAALGFHVLEFLLWGENEDALSPRPASDYRALNALSAQQRDTGLDLTQLPNNRRRQMLDLTTVALLRDFNDSRAIWIGGSASFQNRVGDMSSAQLLVLLVEAMTGMLTEELLVRSLYPLLNGDFEDSIQSPFSHSTQKAVSAQLSSVERLLSETFAANGMGLDEIFISVLPDFEEYFFANFDASKECLVLLYSNLEQPPPAADDLDREFEIVECINLLTIMIDYLEQVKVALSNPV